MTRRAMVGLIMWSIGPRDQARGSGFGAARGPVALQFASGCSVAQPAFDLSIGWDGIDCEKIASRHFAPSATNKRGLEAVKMLNRGLAEMRETGEWYDIVASSLVEASSITQ